MKVMGPPGFNEPIAAAWDQLVMALKQALDSGEMAEHTDPEHLAIVQAILKEEMAGQMLFRAGFFAALTTLSETMRLAVATVPHDCGDPSHARRDTRIGQA
jgi:hypothetical protein